MTTLRDYRFPPAMLETRPGPKGSRLTYIDVRNIAAVLDDLAPGWSSSTVLAHTGNEYYATVTLVVDGISRSDVGSGETPPDAQNQAFRRAAAQHGLGAYLWTGEAVAQPTKPRTSTAAMVNEFNALGEAIYGDSWGNVRRRNCERISNGATLTCEDLSAEALAKLINGLKQLKRQRNGVAA